jgi:DNA processing protein
MQTAEYERQFLAAVRLSRRPGVGARRCAARIDECGDPEKALARAMPPELFAPSDKAPLEDEIARVTDYFARGGRGVYYGAPDYPPALRRAPEPPPYLFRRGPLWPLPAPIVAIVGRRAASPAGCEFARRLAADLAGRGVAVVSGGAVGIDAAAHQGALEEAGGTVLVTATGIDIWYPPEAEALFAAVAARGCLLTELLPGAPPRRDFFPTRNRIIAGLAHALVVVEGRPRSGSFSTWRHMRRLGRPIFTWTGAPLDGAELPALILADGGGALTGPDAEPILRHVAAAPRRG